MGQSHEPFSTGWGEAATTENTDHWQGWRKSIIPVLTCCKGHRNSRNLRPKSVGVLQGRTAEAHRDGFWVLRDDVKQVPAACLHSRPRAGQEAPSSQCRQCSHIRARRGVGNAALPMYQQGPCCLGSAEVNRDPASTFLLLPCLTPPACTSHHPPARDTHPHGSMDNMQQPPVRTPCPSTQAHGQTQPGQANKIDGIY